MSYSKNGFPLEQASKIGHLKMTSHPIITNLISHFEAPELPKETNFPDKTGNIDLDSTNSLNRIVTIDGGQAIVPNEFRPEKQLSFIQVAACMLKMTDLEYMQLNPMIDPRKIKDLTSSHWYHPTVLPLSGINFPNRNLKETVRDVIDATLSQTGLYETLKFIVYREWDTVYDLDDEDKPHMNCWNCGKIFLLPRGKLSFACTHCGHEHRLTDYLRIGADSVDNWTSIESANSLRNVLEFLTLFHFIRLFYDRQAMNSTLFIKDGPLLLRAQLSRLVEPIRDFISFIKSSGYNLYLIGVEKNGNLADFLEIYKKRLPEPGDFFIPSTQYLVEEINGAQMSSNYRNRVNYGAKVFFKAGAYHNLVLNIPTGKFKTNPTLKDLIGFEQVATTLSKLLSYQYPNALIPVTLANSTVSIARKPSGRILDTFVDELMSKNG